MYADPTEKRDWVIRKHGFFYRPNRAGYTDRLGEAGHYTRAEAEAESRVEPWQISAHPISKLEPLAPKCPHCGGAI